LAALLTATLLLAAGVVPASAAEQTAIGAEQAVAIARNLLPVPAAAALTSAALQAGHWVLEWQRPEGAVTAEIDSATGALWAFARRSEKTRPFRYTAEEVRSEAERWLAKLAPDLLEQLRPSGLVPVANGSYVFTWDLLDMGFPLRGDGVTIRIDGHNGDLSGYVRMQRPHGKRLGAVAPPNPEVALKAYQKVDLALEYRQAFRPGSDSPAWSLVYRPAYTFPYVDLVGNLIDQGGAPQPVTTVSSGELVPPLAELPPPPDRPLSEAEAAAVARAALQTDQPPESSQYQVWAGGHGGFWELKWASGHYAVVDAETGLLVWLSDNPADGAGAGVAPAAPLTTAIAFIHRFRPDLAGRLAVASPADSPTVSFRVLYDGIPLNNRMVEVDVHPASGQVTGFRVLPMEAPGDWFPVEDATGILSAEEARAAFLQQSPLELYWVTFERPDGPVTQLLWAPRSDQASEIAAHSGVVMATGGEPITVPSGPADLAGHPARKAVMLLYLSGVMPELEESFRPDEAAIPINLNAWLQRATGRETAAPSGVEVDTCVQWPVSRQVFALWAVQAAGYGPVAAMKARIELSFADADQIGAEYANAAGLLAGVGIIPGDRFEPNRPVTRGEAAQIIQGIITHLQEDTAP
jgi:hypothetical protein